MRLLTQPLDDPDIKAVFQSIFICLQKSVERIEGNLQIPEPERSDLNLNETATYENLADLKFVVAVMSSRC